MATELRFRRAIGVGIRIAGYYVFSSEKYIEDEKIKFEKQCVELVDVRKP